MRSHQRARTWTFADLDRSTGYRMWFDPESFRWELRPDGEQSGTVSTRDVPGAAREDAQRPERGHGEAPGAVTGPAAQARGRHRR